MASTRISSALPRALHSVPFIELRQSFASQIAVISPFVDQLMHFIAKFRKPGGSEAGIEIAVREALANAITHGNHEDPIKRVHVACRCHSDGEVMITVRDEGNGFDSDAIPDPAMRENLLSTHGRGIFLMRTFMDEVRFEEGGTVVHVRKNSNAEAPAQRGTE